MLKLKKFLLDLFFPVECLACSKEGDWLCTHCLNELNNSFKVNSFKLQSSDYLKQVIAVTDYKNKLVADILHQFKYNNIAELGVKISKSAAVLLAPEIRKKSLDFDLVTAVPLSKKRLLWRGFNQSEIIAENIAQKFSWPCDFNLIFRKYNNIPQVGLKGAQRKVNVKDIFKIKNNTLLTNKKVLLVDDVITTGATMQECAKILKEAGAKEVYGLVIAKG